MLPFVAVVDDDPDIRRLVAVIAQRLGGFQAGEYEDGGDFLRRYEPRPGCVVLGIIMPGMDGVEVLGEMNRRAWRVPVVTISGSCSDETATQTLELGAVAFLRKPFQPHMLLDWIERAVLIDTWHRRERSWKRLS